MDKIEFSNLEQVKEQKKGILLIDKPKGWTSHDVVAKIRKLTGVKRVGHAGTLDPLATGLLIVLVSRDFTKLQDLFMKQDKEYLVEAQFGIVTDSYDSMGKEVSRASWDKLGQLTRKKIEGVMSEFTGEISQTVPAFSAVKVKGKKLYQSARKGQLDSELLPKRNVTIYFFKLLDFSESESGKTVKAKFLVKVSSGTYIRSLIHDLGTKLGVGACVVALRRMSIGNFNVSLAESLVD